MKKKPLIALTIILVIMSLLPFLARTFLYPLRYEGIIARESLRNGLDPNLVAAVILQESGFDPDSVSEAGAVGLMQVMPETANELGHDGGLTSDGKSLKEPKVNIALGTRYLAMLRRKYGDDRLALAAYNGGTGNLDLWLRRSNSKEVDKLIESIPFAETKNFVLAVSTGRERYRAMYPNAFKALAGD